MNLNQLTIKQANDGLKKKEFSSVELTQACLEQIKKTDKKLGAFITITEDLALTQARAVDKKGDFSKSLAGIPVAIKDIFCTAGVKTTAASKILENYIPPYSATVVEKLIEQGAVILGKTNMDEFACGSSTETSYFGQTKNPWDLGRVPGGSSGGSAAAIAADQCLYALGTDTGGSIRQPASLCNIVGLKPTYGRVSRFGVIAMASSLDQVGPMTKTVEDTALVLQAIAGLDKKDSTTVPKEVPDYLAELNHEIKGLKIGVPKEYFVAGMDPAVEKTVREAIEKLEKLGAKITEVSLPHAPYGLAVYYIIMPSELSTNLARFDGVRYGFSAKAKTLFENYLQTRGKGFGAEIRRRIMLGTYSLSAGYYDAHYLQAAKVRTLIKNDFEKTLTKIDCLITPTSPTVAFRIGEKMDDPLTMYLADIFTISINIAGVPAISIPAGFAKPKDGATEMPVGLQLIGKQFDESTILRVAHQYQQATDWHMKKPSF
ncbi:MAG: aspartyl/glutamyl-tRNA amidotransferase subunit A [Candidatus Buchananbacteria bacterium RIFCSPHIGHO2_01_FULL_39_14]|uniref:Glutamyl-tRNA(Gln) amidotransferase subunit A n=1 Tax=Candidatus Buchananbacteria bacterium RIFCSPHIGHO2_01_FULL_39_14 TaxID=1797532 RepID=A0A1G1XS28_9BACT|nr:MAG: aspartyl/glutamyl-tRNA amidotransferase subunit A [Candidatus Buchananbacteria bacterium RIFCSPHIGHO2_01_FULL_39_14]OGY49015.1 MAG: aspartyl/glutamyl-tRNA amidotransferase subunit A [Candidatus Buchananbacteria bacterium RIFCSPHIGHO2_02_FULL_39_17]